jgi:hypothetical protein
MRTSAAQSRTESTIFSTVTIAPRRAASAPHTPSRSGGDTATLPSRSATGACSSATSGTSGSSRPTSPNGVSTRAYPAFASMEDRWSDLVTIAGRPRAAASSRCENARNDQCSTSTSPDRYASANTGLGVKFGNVSPEYPVTTRRTIPPRKNSVPRLERLSITSVKPGSRPHHWRTTS